MQHGERATHVWQHLYNPVERWEALVGRDIHSLRSESERCGCPPFAAEDSRKGLPREVASRCVTLLERHHDEYYGPAYMSELASKSTLSGRQRKNPRRLLCCTPRGVLVSVGLIPPISVLTALRPDPTFKDFSGSDADYHREARKRWSKGVHMAVPSTWKAEVLQELTAASEMTPSQTSEAWSLAWAIGHARALAAANPEIRIPLHAAETHLAHHRVRVEQLLEGALRIEPLLSGLEASLHAGQSDEAQDKLFALEDILVVAEVLGFTHHIQHILTDVSRQVAPSPSVLAGFEPLAQQRLEVSGPAAQQLWRTVIEASARVPVRALPAVFDSWLARLEEIGNHLVQGLAQAGEHFEASARVEPLPVLGRPSGQFTVRLEGHCPPGWRLRLFLVDTAHPEGEPLPETDYHREEERWSFDNWRLDGPEDAALVIALAAPTLPEFPSLAEALNAVAAIPDARIATVFLIPSSERTP
ncbi:hypothetical protein [Archangium sp.]|uniref:hypothetical protein n=1 Tax=Archangium sp. TaxID=1872627 RepID=UPI00286C6051|nr:hypothetical protein [Archangium sp.]